ncbi:MAG: hypothetical protein V4724_21340 [Pseudomonadota bacterium]
MKTTLRTIALAVAWMGMACAHAAPQVIGGSADGDSVQIKAPADYRVAPGEFDDYAYSYQLENGQRIKFSQRVHTYYTQLQGEAKTEIFARAPGVFVTASGARLEFRDDGESVAIRNYEKLAVASKSPANTTMMASR